MEKQLEEFYVIIAFTHYKEPPAIPINTYLQNDRRDAERGLRFQRPHVPFLLLHRFSRPLWSISYTHHCRAPCLKDSSCSVNISEGMREKTVVILEGPTDQGGRGMQANHGNKAWQVMERAMAAASRRRQDRVSRGSDKRWVLKVL